MNILQVEDVVKGLPDQRLMQEAQSPSGQVPQFLVVSEIQRRADMRKRHQAEQQQQPQGTIAEQIIGAGPAAPPPQPLQQPPPQQMAAGGIVGMAVGGRPKTFMAPIDGQLLELSWEGYANQQDALEAYFDGMNDARSRQWMGDDDTGLGEGPTHVQFDQEGMLIDPTKPSWDTPSTMEEVKVVGQKPAYSEFDAEVSPHMFDVANVDIPEQALDKTPTRGILDFLTTTTPKDYWDSAKNYWTGEGSQPPPEIPSTRWLRPEESVPGTASGSTADPVEEGIAAVATETGEVPLEAAERTEAAVGAGNEQLRSAEGAAVQGGALAKMMELMDRKKPEIPLFQDLIEQQRRAAYSNALMQLGSGIAGNDLSGGLSRAGAAAAAGMKGARELDAQSRLATYQAEQGEIDRDIQILGKAGIIEASLIRAEADREIEKGRGTRAALTFIMDTVEAKVKDVYFQQEVGENGEILKTAEEVKAEYIDALINASMSAELRKAAHLEGLLTGNQGQPEPVESVIPVKPLSEYRE